MLARDEVEYPEGATFKHRSIESDMTLTASFIDLLLSDGEMTCQLHSPSTLILLSAYILGVA